MKARYFAEVSSVAKNSCEISRMPMPKLRRSSTGAMVEVIAGSEAPPRDADAGSPKGAPDRPVNGRPAANGSLELKSGGCSAGVTLHIAAGEDEQPEEDRRRAEIADEAEAPERDRRN